MDALSHAPLKVMNANRHVIKAIAGGATGALHSLRDERHGLDDVAMTARELADTSLMTP